MCTNSFPEVVGTKQGYLEIYKAMGYGYVDGIQGLRF